MKKERELGGLANVKNEDKIGKSLDAIPSLKAFDEKNGLTGKSEDEKAPLMTGKPEEKKALA